MFEKIKNALELCLKVQNGASSLPLLDALTELPIVENSPVLVGTLNRRLGQIGYHVAEVGHSVYEFEDRYFIVLQPLIKGSKEYIQKYYKDTLKPNINFNV